MATLGTLLAPDLIQSGSCWQVCEDINGYARPDGENLTTQACRGRRFRIRKNQRKRIAVQLLEDGYRCWVNVEDVLGRAKACSPWRPPLLSESEIARRLPRVLSWSETAQEHPNVYLWGGTSKPHMDCSGLMQMAFASQGIWIPRDAYQQERFCQRIAALPDNHDLLRPGDLLFFGTRWRCTHVGLYLGDGRYRHSSGQAHGRNGIGIDSLHSRDQHPVARHYRAEFRCAGRVVRCHDGSHLS